MNTITGGVAGFYGSGDETFDLHKYKPLREKCVKSLGITLKITGSIGNCPWHILCRQKCFMYILFE